MSKLSAIYARCSTVEQFPENQIRVLRELAERNGDTLVAEYIDSGISGSKRDREALNQMLAAARSRKFSKLYVVSIDRLSRSTRDLIDTVEVLNDLKVTIVFQRENIDTTTSTGQFFLTVLGSLAQFEREIMRERINAGIARAKSQGKKMGRPTKLNDGLRSAVKLLYTKGASIRTIASTCQLGIGSVYKVIEEIRREQTAVAA
jgi:DNA invertase Pin-like site-specific DNA recombinase